MQHSLMLDIIELYYVLDEGDDYEFLQVSVVFLVFSQVLARGYSAQHS